MREFKKKKLSIGKSGKKVMPNKRYSRIKKMGGGMMRKGYLTGGQTKLDADGDGKISGKDEFVLLVLTAPILVIAWGVFSDDPGAAEKIKLFFEQFQQLPAWFTNLWILVVASIYGIKGTQIFKNGGKK